VEGIHLGLRQPHVERLHGVAHVGVQPTIA
jgi:hypothetical protein